MRSRPALRSGPLAMAATATSSRPRSARTSCATLSWPAPAVDQDQLGPLAAFALRVFLDDAGEPPGQHLAHHGVVVAGGVAVPGSGPLGSGTFGVWAFGVAAFGVRADAGGSLVSCLSSLGTLDPELAIGRFDEAFGAGHDHGAIGVRALDVAVVVDLDAFGWRVESAGFRRVVRAGGAGCRSPARRRASASRAFMRALSTSLRFPPRCGDRRATLRPSRWLSASAIKSCSATRWLSRMSRGAGLLS